MTDAYAEWEKIPVGLLTVAAVFKKLGANGYQYSAPSYRLTWDGV